MGGLHGLEQGCVGVMAVPCRVKIAANGDLAFGVNGDHVGFAAFGGELQHPVIAIHAKVPNGPDRPVQSSARP